MATTISAPTSIPAAMNAITEAISSVSNDDGPVRIATACLILEKLAGECACLCQKDITASEKDRAEYCAMEVAAQICETTKGLSSSEKLRRLMTIHEDLGRTTAGNVFQRTIAHGYRSR